MTKRGRPVKTEGKLEHDIKVRLDDVTAHRVDEYCKTNSVSRAELIRDAIYLYVGGRAIHEDESITSIKDTPIEEAMRIKHLFEMAANITKKATIHTRYLLYSMWDKAATANTILRILEIATEGVYYGQYQSDDAVRMKEFYKSEYESKLNESK